MKEEKELIRLGNVIESKANGIFLWVYLVMRKAPWMFKEGQSIQQLLALLDKLDPKLDGLYSQILERFYPDDKEKCLDVFRWICYSREP